MSDISMFEFDLLIAADTAGKPPADAHAVPAGVFGWLRAICLEAGERGEASWLRLTQRRGVVALQVTSYAGVIRAPNGFTIEVLPKMGKAIGAGRVAARRALIEMLCCLDGFRHIVTDAALLSAAHMSMPDIVLAQFLEAVRLVVRSGLRGGYQGREENLPVMRGALLIPPHLRDNICRPDRFHCGFDEFSLNRPENRLLRRALDCARSASRAAANQESARQLASAFDDVPPSSNAAQDFRQVRLDRNMPHYASALALARLLIEGMSPLPKDGEHRAPSLLYPMASLFETYAARHIGRQLTAPRALRRQVQSHSFVKHLGRDMMRLRPDAVVLEAGSWSMVLDTKWKLLNDSKGSGSEKYGLSQADFYQLQAYGQTYLGAQGDLVLVYPKTDTFTKPLPVFDFPSSPGLRLWVLPFCMDAKIMLLPDDEALRRHFAPGDYGARAVS